MVKKRVPTILGLTILILGIIVGIFLISSKQIFKLGAISLTEPKNVRISNITEQSFTVSWTTGDQVHGFVQSGNRRLILNRITLDTITWPSFTHSVTIDELDPSTLYYFKINSGGINFDNNGMPWQIKTANNLNIKTVNNLISGSVVDKYGVPVKGALVYAIIGGGSLLSTVTSEGGSWLIPINITRTQSLTDLMDINEESSPLEILALTGSDRLGTLQTFPAAAKPAPPIIIGKNQNLKTIHLEREQEIPKASLGSIKEK